MIKERRYQVHPNTLLCLFHLRLKKELGVRASQTHADKAKKTDGIQKKMRKKDRPHLSKNAKKALKENKDIQNEMKEAEAQVDAEERTSRVSVIQSIVPSPLKPRAVLSSVILTKLVYDYSIRRRLNWCLCCISVF